MYKLMGGWGGGKFRYDRWSKIWLILARGAGILDHLFGMPKSPWLQAWDNV